MEKYPAIAVDHMTSSNGHGSISGAPTSATSQPSAANDAAALAVAAATSGATRCPPKAGDHATLKPPISPSVAAR